MNQTHFTEITSQPSKHTKGREGNASTTEMIQHQGTFCTTWVNCWIHTAYAEVAGMCVCVCVCVCVCACTHVSMCVQMVYVFSHMCN